jgi:hypothetical protein
LAGDTRSFIKLENADVLRAMAHHRLGHSGPAKAALARAANRIDQDLPEAGRRDLDEQKWGVENWLVAQTLRREAEGLIDGRAQPAVRTLAKE